MRRLCIFSIYIFKRPVRARQKENKIICWLRTPTVGTDEQFTLTEAFISQRNLSGQQIELEPRQGASDGRNGDVGESAARSNERSRALVVLGNHTTRAGAKSVDKLLERICFDQNASTDRLKMRVILEQDEPAPDPDWWTLLERRRKTRAFAGNRN